MYVFIKSTTKWVTVRQRLISPSWFYTLLSASGWLTLAAFRFWRSVCSSVNSNSDNTLRFSAALFGCKWQGRVSKRKKEKSQKHSIHQRRLAMQSHRLIKCTRGPPGTLQGLAENPPQMFSSFKGASFPITMTAEKLYLHNISFGGFWLESTI